MNSDDERIFSDDDINITDDEICLTDDENDNMEDYADDMSDFKHDNDSDPNITEAFRWSDLGVTIKRTSKLSEDETYYFLKYHFVPDSNYKFPKKTEYGKVRSCQLSYFYEFDGLVYSESLVLCKYCVLFENQPEEHGPLVTKRFSLWTKTKNNLNEHFKGITTNETVSKGSGIKKKSQKCPKGYASQIIEKKQMLSSIATVANRIQFHC